ncbi:hypothetical protein DPMN_072545 [Dreissena polymorpha]|uniref:Uncharacterized protein n=1 Tax=Dreissena polymorpha TaxID=45954 RepID=A0A9D4BWX0_DREPO|nr:hypothetical protein DPMN_072545 [Dreissena polymorpha]
MGRQSYQNNVSANSDITYRLMRVASITVLMGRQSYQYNGSANSVCTSDDGGINDRSDEPAVILG